MDPLQRPAAFPLAAPVMSLEEHENDRDIEQRVCRSSPLTPISRRHCCFSKPLCLEPAPSSVLCLLCFCISANQRAPNGSTGFLPLVPPLSPDPKSAPSTICPFSLRAPRPLEQVGEPGSPISANANDIPSHTQWRMEPPGKDNPGVQHCPHRQRAHRLSRRAGPEPWPGSQGLGDVRRTPVLPCLLHPDRTEPPLPSLGPCGDSTCLDGSSVQGAVLHSVISKHSLRLQSGSPSNQRCIGRGRGRVSRLICFSASSRAKCMLRRDEPKSSCASM